MIQSGGYVYSDRVPTPAEIMDGGRRDSESSYRTENGTYYDVWVYRHQVYVLAEDISGRFTVTPHSGLESAYYFGIPKGAKSL